MQRSAKIRFVALLGIAFSTLLSAQTPPPAPQPAKVIYSNGQLSVSANNSSLNQILRDISRETKMKITGGVNDERVFGQYGPAAPSVVLNALLDGTSSNMLLLEATASTPAELILTPRHGGATPPNPNAYQDNTPPPYVPSVPEGNVVQPPPGARTTQPPPNGVRTPQQIYEQLERMRQQQRQQQQQQQSNPQ